MFGKYSILGGFWLSLCLMSLALGQPVVFDVFKAVPDVDKPIPVDPNDNSCWQAAAANLLGGAGYGIGAGVNATAQQRADYIYQQLRNDLGFINLGSPERAINYWLYTYGKNPDSNDYLPLHEYTDVTIKYDPNGLTSLDYDFLLDELARCQYVAVSWDQPNHCMTLAGGNKSSVPGNQSIWHDSDQDKGNGPNPPDDDVYTNLFNPIWNMDDPQTIGLDFQIAQKYVTFCPGLNKNRLAVENYDLAYFLSDSDQNGSWSPVFREAGVKAQTYTDPTWIDPVAPILRVGNEQLPDRVKRIELLVDYTDRLAGRELLENVQLLDDQGKIWMPIEVTSSADQGQLLFVWLLDHQPLFEEIIFPDNRYRLLDGNVKDWNLATICIPEPAAGFMVLIMIGSMLLSKRR